MASLEYINARAVFLDSFVTLLRKACESDPNLTIYKDLNPFSGVIRLGDFVISYVDRVPMAGDQMTIHVCRWMEVREQSPLLDLRPDLINQRWGSLHSSSVAYTHRELIDYCLDRLRQLAAADGGTAYPTWPGVPQY